MSALPRTEIHDAAPVLLNFNEADFISTVAGALALAPRLDALIGMALAAGAPNIFLLGAGGAAITMQPAIQLLHARSSFPVFGGPMGELLISQPATLTQGSIVILPSLSGTTAESVQMLALAHARGAVVIPLVGHAATPLGQAGHAVLNSASDASASENFYIQGLLIALSLLRHRGEISNYADLLLAMRTLPQQLLRMKEEMEPQAASYATVLANHGYHIVTAGGNAWAEALSFGMCTLEERQWIRARPIHASDFFHGTLELVEPGTSVIVLKGEDAMRPLAERIERFVPSMGGILTVIDTADYPTSGLSHELRAMLSPIILTTLLDRICAHLEVIRNHPLSTRRYYRRVEY